MNKEEAYKLCCELQEVFDQVWAEFVLLAKEKGADDVVLTNHPCSLDERVYLVNIEYS